MKLIPWLVLTLLSQIAGRAFLPDETFTGDSSPRGLAKQQPELMPTPPMAGRWDLTVHARGGPYPSWLEVKHSGYSTLVGYFVGRVGSVRPVSQVAWKDGTVKWSIPIQWEWRREGDLAFEGKLTGERLEGTTTDDDGNVCRWTGVRAPSLKRARAPEWSEPRALFNGKDLNGWRTIGGRGWRVRDGLLVNAEPGSNLVTREKFDDLQLHGEFRYPRGSNSGLYLRGRYEVQLEDGLGQEPSALGVAGVYGFLKPRLNAARRHAEWQTIAITLVGRTVTVTLNGETVIDRQEIPGPTGGALDSDEAAPGPIMIQGDHGPIEFRKLTVRVGK